MHLLDPASLSAPLIASFRRLLCLSLIAAAAATPSASLNAAPDDRPFRNWGPPLDEGVRARAVFWDRTDAILETEDRKYVFTPIEKLAPADQTYLTSLPLPPIVHDRLRWGVTNLAAEIPEQPTEAFSGRPVAFNGRYFLVAVNDDRISGVVHPISMLNPGSVSEMMVLYMDEMSPDERIRGAAAMHDALWTVDPATAASILPQGQFEDVLPAGALPIAFDGFWFAYKDPPSPDGKPGALQTIRVSEADAKAAKLRDFLMQKFVDGARHLPGQDHTSLMRALARKERLTSAPVGETHFFKGRSVRTDTPNEGRWIYRDETGSVILLADGTIDVVAATDQDTAWYASIGAGTMADTVVYDGFPKPYPWRAWNCLPEGEREARLVVRTTNTIVLHMRTGDYRRFDRQILDAEDAAYVANAFINDYDTRPMRISPLATAHAWGSEFLTPIEVSPLAFNGRTVICATPKGMVYIAPLQSLAVDLRTRKMLLSRRGLEMDADDWIRAAGVTRQAIWQESDGTPLKLDDAFAVAFDGESVLLESDDTASSGADGSDEIEELTGYRFVSLAAPESEGDRRRLEALQRRSDQESRPLETAEPLTKKAFASKGRGEPATLGERRLWTGRLLRSVGPTEGRLVSRNDRTCAVLLEDGTLDLLLGLSKEDAQYLTSVEGFLSPRSQAADSVAYRPADLNAIGNDAGKRVVRAWQTWPLDGERAEAIAWDGERVFLRKASNGDFAMLLVSELLPNDRSWIDLRARPRFEAPTERWTPSSTANEYPGSPTQAFDGAPIAFNGHAVLFMLPGGTLSDHWCDLAALSPESQRKVLERFEDRIDDRTRFLAAWRMRQAIWVEEPGQRPETFVFDPRTKFQPVDRAVAYDGEKMIALLRRPPGVEGWMTRPTYSPLPLGPDGGDFHILEPQLRDRFVAQSRPLPGCEVPQLIAAYERAGRSEPPSLGERRLWQNGTLTKREPTWGRLVQTISASCVFLDDENRLQVTAGLTQEDCDYLNSLEGFRPVDATDEEKAPARLIDYGEPLAERLKRMNEGRVDGEFLRSLDEALAYLRRSGPYDSARATKYTEFMNALASQLLEADTVAREEETKRVKAAVAAGTMSQAAANAKLTELENSPHDPTDGTNPMEKSVALWKNELPDSSFPWTLEAGAFYAVAWQARGDGLAADVTPEGWRVHEQVILRADAAIKEAAKRAPDDYYLRAKQMHIGRSAGYDLEELREVFYEGLEGNRDFYSLVDDMTFTLLPRWYGSKGDIGRFAAEMMDYYGDAEGTIVLNAIISQQTKHDGYGLVFGDYPPETLARAARHLAGVPDLGPKARARAETFAYLGGDFHLAWELKRRSERALDPELRQARESDGDWSVKEFYRALDGPPDVRRVRRIDFEDRDDPPPKATFADSGRLCLTDSGDGGRQAIDVAAMTPLETFAPNAFLEGMRYLPDGSDRWLAGIGVDSAGVRRIVRFDLRAEPDPEQEQDPEPVVMHGTEPFPSAVAMSPYGDRIAASRDQPQGWLTLWDASTGDVQGSVTVPFAVRQLLFAPSGEKIAAWDGEGKLAFVDAATRELGDTIELSGPGHFPQFSRDGRLAFLVRSGATSEPRWNAVAVDAETGEVEAWPSWAGKFPAFGDVEFDEDLKLAFVVGHSEVVAPDRGIYVLDLQTGETVAALDGHFRAVLELKYRSDIQRLFSVGADRHLIEWDVSPAGLNAAKANDAKR